MEFEIHKNITAVKLYVFHHIGAFAVIKLHAYFICAYLILKQPYKVKCFFSAGYIQSNDESFSCFCTQFICYFCHYSKISLRFIYLGL